MRLLSFPATIAALALAACGSNPPPPLATVDAGPECRTTCTTECFVSCQCAFQVPGATGECIDECATGATGDSGACTIQGLDANAPETTVVDAAGAADAHPPAEAAVEDAASGG